MDSMIVHTPEHNISIAEVYAIDGVVYLRFKKPKDKAYEVITLDHFLSLVYARLEDLYFLRNR